MAGAVTDIPRVRERVLVGIDGPPAAGKTTLADQLASRLRLHAVRASVEAFLLPQQIRYQRGELSPDGCYRDSFDYPALMNGLIAPFRAGASRARLSRTTDRASVRDAASGAVPARAVLIFDGVFLLRDQLRHIWDLSVYLCVPPAETLRRALARDLDTFGTTEEIRRRHLARYLPAQAIYRSEADPEATAHIVIGNEAALHTDDQAMAPTRHEDLPAPHGVRQARPASRLSGSVQVLGADWSFISNPCGAIRCHATALCPVSF